MSMSELGRESEEEKEAESEMGQGYWELLDGEGCMSVCGRSRGLHRPCLDSFLLHSPHGGKRIDEGEGSRAGGRAWMPQICQHLEETLCLPLAGARAAAQARAPRQGLRFRRMGPEDQEPRGQLVTHGAKENVSQFST